MSFIRPGRGAAAPQGDFTPSLVVEYVDTSGSRQSVVAAADGSTSISVAPYPLIEFDGSGTRTDVVTTAAAAWSKMTGGGAECGYEFDFGESIGGTWQYGGATKDKEIGPAIAGRVFTTFGAKTVTLKVRDTAGDQGQVSVTVNIAEPDTYYSGTNTVVISQNTTTTGAPAGAQLLTNQTSWPTFESNKRYLLQGGQDFTSFSTVNLQGLHNILIGKNGTGTDPIISMFAPDNRAMQSVSITRAKHCRTVDVQVGQFRSNAVGFDYCGVIRNAGTMRLAYHGTYPSNYASATTSTQRGTLQYPRGYFLHECANIIENPFDGLYVSIAAYRSFYMTGCVVNKSVSSTQHMFRNGHHKAAYRHNNFYCGAATNTHFKMQADGAVEWFEDHDLVGALDGSGFYNYRNSYVVCQHNQHHRSGSTLPNTVYAVSPQAPDSQYAGELHSYVAIEDEIWFGTDASLQNPNIQNFGGEYISLRNMRGDLGAGAYATMSTNANTPTVNGPYFNEEAKTRPVPV